MSRRRFAAARLTTAQATEFWQRAVGATAFTRPEYLARLVDDVQWWGVERSGQVVAAWPLVRAVAGGPVAPPPFCYYVGPLFARSLGEGIPYSRYWSGYTDAFSVLVDAVTAAQPRFRFSVPVQTTDLRVFEWWNFEHSGEPGFRVTPRYTARIDLSAFADEEALRSSFAGNRRREIARWATVPTAVVDDVDPADVTDLHDEALRRSGGIADTARHAALSRALNLVLSGAGSIVGAVPPGSTRIEAAIVLLDGPDETNSLFYSASDEWRGQGLTSWIVWQGLLRAQASGRRWFDFNGANSPRRAADKHFYGAKTELYFDGSFGEG